MIVHLGRMRDKSRKVLQIAEVLNLQNGEIPLRTIYEFEEQGKGEDGKVEGKLVRRAETLENNAKNGCSRNYRILRKVPRPHGFTDVMTFL